MFQKSGNILDTIVPKCGIGPISMNGNHQGPHAFLLYLSAPFPQKGLVSQGVSQMIASNHPQPTTRFHRQNSRCEIWDVKSWVQDGSEVFLVESEFFFWGGGVHHIWQEKSWASFWTKHPWQANSWHPRHQVASQSARSKWSVSVIWDTWSIFYER